MNFIERLKLLGYKEFWKAYFDGVGIGWEMNMELLKKNKLNIFLVILNVIFVIPMIIISILLMICSPKVMDILCKATDKGWKDLGVKSKKD